MGGAEGPDPDGPKPPNFLDGGFGGLEIETSVLHYQSVLPSGVFDRQFS